MQVLRLSSSLSGRYKPLQTYAYPSLLVLGWMLIAFQLYQKKDLFFMAYTSLWVGSLSYMLYSRGKKLYPLSYDLENLYLQQLQQEEIIPLWQIKEVTLTSLNGGYKIDFDGRYQARGFVLFLPSFWYPFNYKSMDGKVNPFRQAIRKAKKSRMIDPDSFLLPS